MLDRYAVLPSPSLASDPQVLLLSNFKAPINHAESTLLQVFFLKNLKPFGINTGSVDILGTIAMREIDKEALVVFSDEAGGTMPQVGLLPFPPGALHVSPPVPPP